MFYTMLFFCNKVPLVKVAPQDRGEPLVKQDPKVPSDPQDLKGPGERPAQQEAKARGESLGTEENLETVDSKGGREKEGSQALVDLPGLWGLVDQVVSRVHRDNVARPAHQARQAHQVGQGKMEAPDLRASLGKQDPKVSVERQAFKVPQDRGES